MRITQIGIQSITNELNFITNVQHGYNGKDGKGKKEKLTRLMGNIILTIYCKAKNKDLHINIVL